MLFGEAKCANLGRPNVSILGVANVLRPSELPPSTKRTKMTKNQRKTAKSEKSAKSVVLPTSLMFFLKKKTIQSSVWHRGALGVRCIQ